MTGPCCCRSPACSSSRPGSRPLILTKHLHRCTVALAESSGPEGVYQAVQEGLSATIGLRLFTLLTVTDDAAEVQRVWTNNPTAYPLQGRKRMGPTPWGAHVLRGRQPWMCNDADGIRWAFPDHALIESLGLAASVNVPVVAFGRVLGTMNALDRAGAYEESCLEVATLFAPYLVPAFLR